MVDVEKQRLLPPPAYSPPLNPLKAFITLKLYYPFTVQAIIRIFRVIVLIPCALYICNYFDGNTEVVINSYVFYKLLAIIVLQILHVVALFLSWDDGCLWCALQVSSSVLIILMPLLSLLNSVPLDVWVSLVGSYVLLIIEYMFYLLIVSDLQTNHYNEEAISVALTCFWCTWGLFSFSWTWKVDLFLVMAVLSGSQLLMGIGIKSLVTHYKQSRRK